MNFLKLLLAILSTVFSMVVLIVLAFAVGLFLIFSNLQDVFSYEKKFTEFNKKNITQSLKLK